MIPPITAPPESLTLVNTVQNQTQYPQQDQNQYSCAGPNTNPSSGVNSTAGQSMTQPGNSPALIGAPVYNSQQRTLTPWGLGWSNDNDQYLTINSSYTVAWTQTSGEVLTFFNVAAASVTTPSYAPPVSIYDKLTATALTNGVPTSFNERDKDGTTRTFLLYSSTYVFRLSGLVDRNGNTVTYTRNGSGYLTKVTDVHGRYINIAYNSNNMVATLSDSGGRTVSYRRLPS